MNKARESLETRRALAEVGLSGKGMRVFDPTETIGADIAELRGCVVTIVGTDLCVSHRLDVLLLEEVCGMIPACDILFDFPQKQIGKSGSREFDAKGIVLEILVDDESFLSKQEILKECFLESILQGSSNPSGLYMNLLTHEPFKEGMDIQGCDDCRNYEKIMSSILATFLLPFCLRSRLRVISLIEGMCPNKNVLTFNEEEQETNDEQD